MDKLHREHNFINQMWKFMKTCESRPFSDRDADYWDAVQTEAERLSHDYENLSYADNWIISYLKFLNREEAKA